MVGLGLRVAEQHISQSGGGRGEVFFNPGMAGRRERGRSFAQIEAHGGLWPNSGGRHLYGPADVIRPACRPAISIPRMTSGRRGRGKPSHHRRLHVLMGSSMQTAPADDVLRGG